jgi:two-component system, OmpR family, sensor histidine kinase KdpD
VTGGCATARFVTAHDKPGQIDRNQRAARAARGTLRIFFGFAPGVGKTWRMLTGARQLAEQRVDVVVGAVDTHGRYETAALLLGLDMLRRKRNTSDSAEEFDLDAALARAPAVLLLDELAHTNAPGSRHARRWQDVLELLEAGIHVHTTLNVQHVESLNDVIEQITTLREKETVPDAILDRADSIELVDVPPGELLQRLRDGKVFLPEEAARAADRLFQTGSLLALRELALRRLAERVDSEVQAYREEHGVQSPWPACERVLVCVGPAPSSARLIRAACRIAAGLRAPWVAASVDLTQSAVLSSNDHDRLESHLRLAESLGATVARLGGTRISDAVLEYARKHNVTRIVIGKPTHSRLRDIVKGSVLQEVVRGSGDIDVNVISGDPGSDKEPGAAPRQLIERPLSGYLLSAVLVGATTALAWMARSWAGVPDLEMLYLLAVVVCAARWGRGPSLVAAALSVIAYDVFFVPPHFTLAVADARYFLSFLLLFGAGFVVSNLTHQIRNQERESKLREERTAALYAFSHDLAAALDVPQVAEATARHAADGFDAPAAVLVGEGQASAVRGAWPLSALLDPGEREVADWVLEHGRLAGIGTETFPGSGVLCAPLSAGGAPLGSLALRLKRRAKLTSDQRGFLDAFARQAALALARAMLAAEARASALRATTEQMRSSLLASVSHDLRTPLGAITGAASTLRDEPLDDRTRHELADMVCVEAERLERLLSNLLDMTRLESGAAVARKEWVPLEELVGAALTRMESRLGSRDVRISLAQDLPLLPVDPVLMQQLFVNLLENAAKYTPDGTAIEVRAERGAESVVVEVADHGPGIPAGEEERVFERFHRGSHPGIAGAGLGLPICRGIAHAHGGSLVACRHEGGACFRLTLPVAGEPPRVEDEPRQEET